MLFALSAASGLLLPPRGAERAVNSRAPRRTIAATATDPVQEGWVRDGDGNLVLRPQARRPTF